MGGSRVNVRKEVPVSSWLFRPELHEFLERITWVPQTIPPEVSLFFGIVETAGVELTNATGILREHTGFILGWQVKKLLEQIHCVVH